MRSGFEERCRVSLPSRVLVLFLLFSLLIIPFFSSCQRRVDPQEVENEGNAGDPEAEGPSLSFLVCGDPHGRTDLLERIISDLREGEFLVILGDLGTGKGEGELRRIKDCLDLKGIRYFVVPGDNDQPGGDLSAYQRVFGQTRYSLEIGPLRLIFLNNAVPGVGITREDLVWLEEELASSRGKRTIAFAHVPPGAPVDISQGFREESASQRRMKELLVGAGVEVVYCGHLHAYMIYSKGPPRVVVSGGAGARPHLSEEAGGFHHYLRVTVGREISEEVIRL